MRLATLRFATIRVVISFSPWGHIRQGTRMEKGSSIISTVWVASRRKSKKVHQSFPLCGLCTLCTMGRPSPPSVSLWNDGALSPFLPHVYHCVPFSLTLSRRLMNVSMSRICLFHPPPPRRALRHLNVLVHEMYLPPPSTSTSLHHLKIIMLAHEPPDPLKQKKPTSVVLSQLKRKSRPCSRRRVPVYRDGARRKHPHLVCFSPGGSPSRRHVCRYDATGGKLDVAMHVPTCMEESPALALCTHCGWEAG